MNQTRISRLIRWTLVAAAAALSGGAFAGDYPKDFGDTVRHMIEQQIYDRAAAANPKAEPPIGLDGERAAAALEAYRTQTKLPPLREDVVNITVHR